MPPRSLPLAPSFLSSRRKAAIHEIGKHSLLKSAITSPCSRGLLGLVQLISKNLQSFQSTKSPCHRSECRLPAEISCCADTAVYRPWSLGPTRRPLTSETQICPLTSTPPTPTSPAATSPSLLYPDAALLIPQLHVLRAQHAGQPLPVFSWPLALFSASVPTRTSNISMMRRWRQRPWHTCA
jgi:hypothetical protein